MILIVKHRKQYYEYYHYQSVFYVFEFLVIVQSLFIFSVFTVKFFFLFFSMGREEGPFRPRPRWQTVNFYPPPTPLEITQYYNITATHAYYN